MYDEHKWSKEVVRVSLEVSDAKNAQISGP